MLREWRDFVRCEVKLEDCRVKSITALASMHFVLNSYVWLQMNVRDELNIVSTFHTTVPLYYYYAKLRVPIVDECFNAEPHFFVAKGYLNVGLGVNIFKVRRLFW